MLANVDKNILSPAYSKPVMTFKQDTPAGIYVLTERKQSIDWHYAMNILMHIEGNEKLIDKNDYSSYELFSHIIPNMINYVKMGSNGNKSVEIVNGKLIKGTINGTILTQELIMAIWDRYGPKKTRVFIDNAQRLAEMVIFHKGISIGYKDTIPSQEISDKIKKIVHEKIAEISCLLTEAENNPNMIEYDLLEKYITTLLQAVKSDCAADAMKLLTSENKFFLHIDSKSKGSNENVGEILGVRGQEILQFARLGKEVNGRCLPHFCLNDDTALSRGFIPNNYHDGMNPADFWFYHQGGREGIINTAIKTADSGYQQRRLIKAMESIYVAYDKTVRTSNGVVLQILYGDNQLDNVMQRRVYFKTMEMNNEQLKNIHLYDNDIPNKSYKKLNVTFVNDLIKMRDQMRIIQLKTHLKYGTFKTSFYQGANYVRIINDIINTDDSTKELVDPMYVFETIQKMLLHESIPLLCYVNDDTSPIKSKDEVKFKFLLRYGLYEFLSPKRCTHEYKLTKNKFDQIVKEIIESYIKALIHAGEMVGVGAAQGMGEPLTQMTLSSFHKSGSGVAGLRGTPRLKEILGNGKKITTPIMLVYMKEDYRKNKALVQKIAANLRFTVFKDIIRRVTTIYDPLTEYIESDMIDTSSIFDAKDGTKNVDMKTYPWLFRIWINKEKLLDFDINMLDIKAKFNDFWIENAEDNKKNKVLFSQINNACIASNFDNSEEPYVHIRIDINNINEKTLSEFRNLILMKFYIKGDEKIKKIDNISEDTVYTFNSETGDVVKEQEYVIYTDGINFEKIRNLPQVDQNRTTCNDIRAITTLYGIESTRTVLLNEIGSIFSDEINYHHLSIVADLMTHTGIVTSIDRFGLRKLNIGVLAKATFEETMEILTDAAIFNQSDHLKNVSSSIMLGKPFKGGTGLCQIMMDNQALERSEFNNENSEIIAPITFSKMPLIDDILKKTSNHVFLPELEK